MVATKFPEIFIKFEKTFVVVKAFVIFEVPVILRVWPWFRDAAVRERTVVSCVFIVVPHIFGVVRFEAKLFP